MKPDPAGKLSLRDLGERTMIRRLLDRLRAAGAGYDGIGDDAAVLPGCGGMDWVLASDPVIEGVHFSPADDRFAVGGKAVGRVLSDFAAMAAEPLWVLFDLVAPELTPVEDVEAMYDGAGQLLRQYGVLVAGGDLAAGPALEMHVAGLGRVPAGTALLRSGAQAGDLLLVSGSLGYSRRGRHLAIEPRLEHARWLREGKRATAAIDISDGLAADALRLAEMSCLTVNLDGEKIPVTAVGGYDDGIPPLQHALNDGEDHELLFSVPRERGRRILADWNSRFEVPCSCIGILEAGPAAVLLDGEPVTGGYRHFEK